MCRILSSSTTRYILFNRQIKIESHGIENYLQSLRWWVVFHASFGACRMFNAPYYGNFSWRLWLDLFITVLVSSVYFYSRRTSVACHCVQKTGIFFIRFAETLEKVCFLLFAIHTFNNIDLLGFDRSTRIFEMGPTFKLAIQFHSHRLKLIMVLI